MWLPVVWVIVIQNEGRHPETETPLKQRLTRSLSHTHTHTHTHPPNTHTHTHTHPVQSDTLSEECNVPSVMTKNKLQYVNKNVSHVRLYLWSTWSESSRLSRITLTRTNRIFHSDYHQHISAQWGVNDYRLKTMKKEGEKSRNIEFRSLVCTFYSLQLRWCNLLLRRWNKLTEGRRLNNKQHQSWRVYYLLLHLS